MSIKSLAKRIASPIVSPLLKLLVRRLAESETVVNNVQLDRAAESQTVVHNFQLDVLRAARSLAASGDHRVVLPVDGVKLSQDPIALKIGMFGNIGNKDYNSVRSMRRCGFDAELMVGDGWFDTFPMSRPFWEDVSIECSSYEEGMALEKDWQPPSYVKHVAYDVDLQIRYQNRYSAIPEVQERYKQEFGIDLAADRALLLAQHMGHWPCLALMKRYDVVQLSMAQISLGPFCPRPFVVQPVGGDIYISAFQETVFGLLMRAGFRSAAHVAVCETDYPAYLNRLGTTVPRTFLPLMVDTDIYVPGSREEVRSHWTQAIGGSRFILNVCRQSWEWKGNDRLIRAFCRFANDADDWRLVLQEWGTDIAASKALIADLGIQSRVLWQPLCSKPLLRERQRAADVVADQFVMEGYGTSVLESLAAATPVMMVPAPLDNVTKFIGQPPPFVGARTEDEILAALCKLRDDDFRVRRGLESRRWVEKFHGHSVLAPLYHDLFRAAASGQSSLHDPGNFPIDTPLHRIYGRDNENSSRAA